MNRLHSVIATLGFAAAAASASAQFYPPPPPAYPGYTNFKLRAIDPYAAQWDIGVNVRARLEAKDDAGFTSAGQNRDFSGGRPPLGNADLFDNNNTYGLLRIMPRIGYTDKWYQLFVQGRSNFSFDDERGNNGTTNVNPATPGVVAGDGEQENNYDLSLHQAYVFVGNHKEFPLSAKIGRQELAYGDQRQVGHFLWNNNARSFDAGKVRYQNAFGGLDLFTGGVVYHDNRNFDESHYDNDKFSGAYFNLTKIPGISRKQIVETYLFSRNVDAASVTEEDWAGVAAPFRQPYIQDLYTIGLRVKSKPNAYGNWDYTAEAMHQFGSINSRNPNGTAVTPVNTPLALSSAPELDQEAYAAIAQLGYTWSDLAWQPRLSLTYSYASGDRDANDGVSNTFQNQFATTHFFYGYMDLNSLQNLHDIRLALEVKPTPKLRVALEAHLQRLASTDDYWYNVGGVPRGGGTQVLAGGTGTTNGTGYGINSGNSSELGQEIDLIIGYSPVPYFNIEAGISHYFRGDYIKQSWENAPGSSKDASYAYLQLTLNL
ncbi:MAG: hypothetical protein K0R17_202 [Rariglobus sp.]|jgi:hypothetical protein|nr:hypothetical protein [Rariglobus sp.]